MSIQIDCTLTPQKLLPQLNRLWELSALKILDLDRTWDPSNGTPVFTIQGKYTSRSWTEWTQGFQFGSALLQFDATGDETFLELGRRQTLRYMATHVSHVGVHDHGFNNISTYGALLRLLCSGRVAPNPHEQATYELALKVSGAIQAARWTRLGQNRGYIYSFNGPHSLFIDTMRSLRSLGVAHQLGHVLMGEKDARISLLARLVQHARCTAEFAIYYGKGRDAYDVRGRTAHESIFNVNDGSYRCPSSQQGFSPFTTWTRGLAWGLLGFAEQLEFLDAIPRADWSQCPGESAESVREFMLAAALATADCYVALACTDGIPVWDTGAPHLCRMSDYADKVANPYNAWEPVDSSAAAIAAQGLLRLGNVCRNAGDEERARQYHGAGLTVARTLFAEPYLSTDPQHQGLILHSVYHRPNGWDYIAPGQRIPNGESSAWGDYHARELALWLWREAHTQPYYTFFESLPPRATPSE